MSTAEHRIATLELLAAALRAGRPLPLDLAERLATAIREHLDSGMSLDTTIGLPAAVRTQLARTRRDQHLRAAAEHVAGSTPWARAEALADAVYRFLGPAGRRWRESATPPTAEPTRALWLAYRQHALPTTARQLSTIIGAGSEIGGACDFGDTAQP